MEQPAFRPESSSSGKLKTKISLANNCPQIINSDPFYLCKGPPERSEQTGATNLLSHYGLEHTYNKFTTKKIKEELSAFLPSLPGMSDSSKVIPNSTLRSVIENPPICGKSIVPLTALQLTGFRLHPGHPLPEKYLIGPGAERKHKKKDSKKERPESSNVMQPESSTGGHEKHKHKKSKKSDEEKKKKKKDKKSKKHVD